jgi:hypothetical protein
MVRGELENGGVVRPTRTVLDLGPGGRFMPLQGEAKKLYQREYMRRLRAGKPTAKPRPMPKPEMTTQPQSCAWCGRSGKSAFLVGENAVMICERCIEEASVAIAEARAAKKRAALYPRDDGAEESDGLA